jgi:hypothetical protein
VTFTVIEIAEEVKFSAIYFDTASSATNFCSDSH